MADGSIEKAQSYFKMETVKKVAIAGAAGGTFVFVSDFFLDRMFKDDAGADQENAELMRAGAQAVGGLALAGIVARWNKIAAAGIAIGALLGAVRHLFKQWDFSATLDEWFPENDTGTTTTTTTTTPPRTTTALSLVGRSRAS